MTAGARIQLESLTKRYPGQAEAAVAGIDLDIPAGGVVVLVGPSGCGKTTVLKMINRIIEPTSGRIVVDGRDVTRTDPDELRRHIGYVIQQVGLFPHLTVAQNVAMVPRLLGWDRARTEARVDELLDLVGLDPGVYRQRYPKELSGGQSQRVGVARAMGGDPPVMLMDEPFGAIDPITRDRLQNEFLRIQAELRKTVVFVTHDIDEAIKMGDRIAVLTRGSHVEQYDSPEVLLAAPATPFVADLIGAHAVLKRLGLTRLRDVELDRWDTAPVDEDRDALRRRLAAGGPGALVLVDDDQRPLRRVSAGDLGPGPDGGPGLPLTALAGEATLRDALAGMVSSTAGCVAVTDGGRYVGVADLATVTRAVDGMRAAARSEHPRAAPAGGPAGESG